MPERRSWWFALVLLLTACAHTPDGESEQRFYRYAGWLPRQTVQGEPFAAERLKGHVVMITFLSTWCFPCMADLVSIERSQSKFGPRGYQNVLVGMDLEGELVLVPMAEQFKVTVPVLLADQRLREGQSPFGRIRELPSRFLFGRDGTLLAAFAGVVTPEELDKVLSEALERK